MQAVSAERVALLTYLDAQRSSVLAIVADLDEASWRRSVVPSGWTPLGLLEHLGHAERFWSQVVLADRVSPLPWPAGEDSGRGPGFVSGHAVGDVVAFYQGQSARTDEILDGPRSTTDLPLCTDQTCRPPSPTSATWSCTSSRRPPGTPVTSTSRGSCSTGIPASVPARRHLFVSSDWREQQH